MGGLACTAEEKPIISKEVATKVLCFDLVQAAGGTLGSGATGEPAADAATFREDAELFREAGDNETADRIERFADDLEGSVGELTVVLQTAATDADVDAAQDAIEALDGVRAVEFVSSEQAIADLQEEFADNPELVQDLPEDSVPPSFRVTFDSFEELEAARGPLERLDPVEEARPAGNMDAAAVTEMAAEFQEACGFGD